MIQIKLKEYINEKGISINWLSETTGIRYATIHDMVHQKRKSIHLNHLAKIMKALNISDVSILLCYDKEMKTKERIA